MIKFKHLPKSNEITRNNMKIIRNSAVVALAVLAIACNKEENYTPAPKEGKPVNFRMTVAGIGTKTVTEADGNNRNVSWREGDAVGIFVNDEASAYKYGYSVADGWTSAAAIFAQPDASYNFYSYYPYDPELITAESSTSLEASVLANQNDRYDNNSGFDLSDVLLASRENVTGEALENVELQYSHAFAMVEVLVSGTLVDAAPESVTLGNVVRSATIDLKTKAVALKAGATAGTVKMYRVEPVAEGAKGYLYRAIVPAQSVEAGEVLLEVVLAENSYRFKSSVAVPYEAGKYRRIEAVIGNEEGGISLKFPAGSADAWTPSTGLPDGGGEEVPVDLVTIKIADLTAETYNDDGTVATPGTFKIVKDAPSYLVEPKNTNFVGETSWTMSVHSSETTSKITAEFLPEENCIRMYSMTADPFNFSGWYKSGLRYHRVEAFAPGYYRLKFAAKKGASATFDQFQLYARTCLTTAHGAKSDPNWGSILFYIKTGVSACGARKFIKCTDDWVETTVYFDFNKAFSDIYQTTADYKAKPYDEAMSNDAEAYEMLNIAFVPNGKGIADFYIKDVELVKVTEETFNTGK